MRSGWSSAAVILTMAASCGDNAPAGATSGSRLSLRRYVYEDGTAQVDRGWYLDEVRQEPCASQRWVDGARYCTPAFAETAYADSQCLTRIARVPIGADVRYAVGRGIDDYISEVYPIAGPFSGESTFTWALKDGRCLGPFAADRPSELFQLQQAEPRDAFVPIVRTTSTNERRLRVVYEASEDGMRSPVALYDRETDLECQPAPRFDAAVTECVPVSAAPAAYFGDPACTVRVAAVSTLRLPDAIAAVADGCPAYYSVGDEAQRLWSGGGCSEIDLPAGARYFAAGKRLELAAVPRVEQMGARIALVGVDEHEPQLTDTFVHDSQLGVDCAPGRRGEDLRCMPPAMTGAPIVQRFVNADCTGPISIVYMAPEACSSTPSFMVEVGGGLRRLTQPYEALLYERKELGVCTVAPTPAGTIPRPVEPQLPDLMLAAVELR